jgi:hypothetical protein
LGFIIFYGAFRFVFRKKLEGQLGWLALALSLIGAAIITYGGYLGGEIVYRHGTGVIAAETQTARADSLAQALESYKLGMDKQMSDMDKKMQKTAKTESGEHHHQR